MSVGHNILLYERESSIAYVYGYISTIFNEKGNKSSDYTSETYIIRIKM